MDNLTAFAGLPVVDSAWNNLKYKPDDWQAEIVHEDYLSYVHEGRTHFAYWLPTGTGKTIIQTMLAAAVGETIRRQTGVAPTAWIFTMDTLKFQWVSEIGKVDPRIEPFSANPLDIMVIDGSAPERLAQLFMIKAMRDAGNPVRYVITNYDTLRINLPEILDALGARDMVFLDEADQIQNPGSDRGKAARALAYKAYVRVVASASLIYNKIDDLFAILMFLCPDDIRMAEFGKGDKKISVPMPFEAVGFGTMGDFLRTFAVLDRFGNIKGVRNVPELHRRIEAMGFHVREKRELLDLPDLNVSVERIELTPLQKKVYEMAVAGFIRKLEEMQVSWDSGDDRGMMIHNILAWLTAVRRATSLSPVQYVSDMIRKQSVKDGLPANWERLEGELTNENAKLAWMRDYLDAHQDEPGGWLFYSQWTDALDVMNEGLREYARKVGLGRIDGSASTKERERVRLGVLEGSVRLVMTSNAGGRGLNLQKLNHVIANDIPWTPTELNQVFGRIERRGQENEMWVHYLVAKDTIDDKKMLPMILKKAKDQNAVAFGERGRRYEDALGVSSLDEILGWL